MVGLCKADRKPYIYTNLTELLDLSGLSDCFSVVYTKNFTNLLRFGINLLRCFRKLHAVVAKLLIGQRYQQIVLGNDMHLIGFIANQQGFIFFIYQS